MLSVSDAVGKIVEPAAIHGCGLEKNRVYHLQCKAYSCEDTVTGGQEVLEVEEGDAADVDGDGEHEEGRVDHPG